MFSLPDQQLIHSWATVAPQPADISGLSSSGNQNGAHTTSFPSFPYSITSIAEPATGISQTNVSVASNQPNTEISTSKKPKSKPSSKKMKLKFEPIENQVETRDDVKALQRQIINKVNQQMDYHPNKAQTWNPYFHHGYPNTTAHQSTNSFNSTSVKTEENSGTGHLNYPPVTYWSASNKQQQSGKPIDKEFIVENLFTNQLQGQQKIAAYHQQQMNSYWNQFQMQNQFGFQNCHNPLSNQNAAPCDPTSSQNQLSRINSTATQFLGECESDAQHLTSQLSQTSGSGSKNGSPVDFSMHTSSSVDLNRCSVIDLATPAEENVSQELRFSDQRSHVSMTASEFSVPALTNQQQLQSTCAFTGADGTPNFSQVVKQTQQTQGHIASDFGQAPAVASKTDINGYLHGQQNEAPSQTNYNQFCSFPSNDFLGNTSKLGMQFQAQQYFNQQFPNYPHTQQMYMNMSHPFYNNNQQSNGCQYINNNEKVREDEADGGKSKRIRTLYTKFQTRVLEYYFAQNQYIGLPQRAAIAAQLQLSQTQIKIWFQNKRAKIRRNERGFVLQPNPQSGQITESAQSESPQQENDVNSDAHEMNKENVNILDALSRERDLADVYEQNENERQQQESNVNDHSLSCQTGFENRNCGSEPRTAVLAQCDNLQMINPQQQSMLICESE